MALKKKTVLVNCPVKPTPPGGNPGQIVGPSVEGAPELTLFERAIDPFQTGADLAPGNNGVLGSNSANPLLIQDACPLRASVSINPRGGHGRSWEKYWAKQARG